MLLWNRLTPVVSVDSYATRAWPKRTSAALQRCLRLRGSGEKLFDDDVLEEDESPEEQGQNRRRPKLYPWQKRKRRRRRRDHPISGTHPLSMALPTDRPPPQTSEDRRRQYLGSYADAVEKARARIPNFEDNLLAGNEPGEPTHEYLMDRDEMLEQRQLRLEAAEDIIFDQEDMEALALDNTAFLENASQASRTDLTDEYTTAGSRALTAVGAKEKQTIPGKIVIDPTSLGISASDDTDDDGKTDLSDQSGSSAPVRDKIRDSDARAALRSPIKNNSGNLDKDDDEAEERSSEAIAARMEEELLGRGFFMTPYTPPAAAAATSPAAAMAASTEQPGFVVGSAETSEADGSNSDASSQVPDMRETADMAAGATDAGNTGDDRGNARIPFAHGENCFEGGAVVASADLGSGAVSHISRGDDSYLPSDDVTRPEAGAARLSATEASATPIRPAGSGLRKSGRDSGGGSRGYIDGENAAAAAGDGEGSGGGSDVMRATGSDASLEEALLAAADAVTARTEVGRPASTGGPPPQASLPSRISKWAVGGKEQRSDAGPGGPERSEEPAGFPAMDGLGGPRDEGNVDHGMLYGEGDEQFDPFAGPSYREARQDWRRADRSDRGPMSGSSTAFQPRRARPLPIHDEASPRRPGSLDGSDAADPAAAAAAGTAAAAAVAASASEGPVSVAAPDDWDPETWVPELDGAEGGGMGDVAQGGGGRRRPVKISYDAADARGAAVARGAEEELTGHGLEVWEAAFYSTHPAAAPVAPAAEGAGRSFAAQAAEGDVRGSRDRGYMGAGGAGGEGDGDVLGRKAGTMIEFDGDDGGSRAKEGALVAAEIEEEWEQGSSGPGPEPRRGREEWSDSVEVSEAMDTEQIEWSINQVEKWRQKYPVPAAMIDRQFELNHPDTPEAAGADQVSSSDDSNIALPRASGQSAAWKTGGSGIARRPEGGEETRRQRREFRRMREDLDIDGSSPDSMGEVSDDAAPPQRGASRRRRGRPATRPRLSDWGAFKNERRFKQFIEEYFPFKVGVRYHVPSLRAFVLHADRRAAERQRQPAVLLLGEAGKGALPPFLRDAPGAVAAAEDPATLTEAEEYEHMDGTFDLHRLRAGLRRNLETAKEAIIAGELLPPPGGIGDGIDPTPVYDYLMEAIHEVDMEIDSQNAVARAAKQASTGGDGGTSGGVGWNGNSPGDVGEFGSVDESTSSDSSQDQDISWWGKRSAPATKTLPTAPAGRPVTRGPITVDGKDFNPFCRPFNLQTLGWDDGLPQNWAPPAQEEFLSAVREGEWDRSRLAEFIARGARVNAPGEVRTGQCMALHWAAWRGHLKTCEALIELGADLWARSADGSTPLHCAAFWGHLGVIRLLVHSADRAAAVLAEDEEHVRLTPSDMIDSAGTRSKGDFRPMTVGTSLSDDKQINQTGGENRVQCNIEADCRGGDVGGDGMDDDIGGRAFSSSNGAMPAAVASLVIPDVDGREEMMSAAWNISDGKDDEIDMAAVIAKGLHLITEDADEATVAAVYSECGRRRGDGFALLWVKRKGDGRRAIDLAECGTNEHCDRTRAIVWMRQRMGIEDSDYVAVIPRRHYPGDPNNEMDEKVMEYVRIPAGPYIPWWLRDTTDDEDEEWNTSVNGSNKSCLVNSTTAVLSSGQLPMVTELRSNGSLPGDDGSRAALPYKSVGDMFRVERERAAAAEQLRATADYREELGMHGRPRWSTSSGQNKITANKSAREAHRREMLDELIREMTDSPQAEESGKIPVENATIAYDDLVDEEGLLADDDEDSEGR